MHGISYKQFSSRLSHRTADSNTFLSNWNVRHLVILICDMEHHCRWWRKFADESSHALHFVPISLARLSRLHHDKGREHITLWNVEILVKDATVILVLRHLDAAISAERGWLGCHVITKLKGDFCWAVIKGNVLGIKAHKEPRRPGRNRRGNVSPICKNVKLAYFSFLFWIWIT